MIFWGVLGFFALCGAAIGIAAVRNTQSHDYGWEAGIGFFWGSIVGFFIALLVSGIVSSRVNDHTTAPKDQRYNLISVIDAEHTESHLSGAFVLVAGGVSGSSSTELQYAWYQRNPDTGAIIPRTGIQADYDTSIEIYYLHKNQHPYVVRHQTDVMDSTPSWIAPFNVNWSGYYEIEDHETWQLHVPRDAVVRTFKLDLK